MSRIGSTIFAAILIGLLASTPAPEADAAPAVNSTTSCASEDLTNGQGMTADGSTVFYSGCGETIIFLLPDFWNRGCDIFLDLQYSHGAGTCEDPQISGFTNDLFHSGATTIRVEAGGALIMARYWGDLGPTSDTFLIIDDAIAKLDSTR